MGARQTGSTKKRLIGVVVPVGALRSGQSTGVGEFPDLVEFARLCKRMDIGLIQLLPVNDSGYESSPYSALTAFALHPIYLRIGDLPELGLSGGAPWVEKLAALGREFEGELRFSFWRIMQAKIGLLREIYAAHRENIEKSARSGGALGAWVDRNPWVKEYAVFRQLKEENGLRSWKEWEEHRHVTAKQVAALWEDPERWDRHLFWVWIQEALDTQFSRAAEAVAREGILLEGDLPILMNDDSCDVWAHGEYFYMDLSAGAPPDMYSPEGQRWGFPIYNWQALAKDDYTWWRNRLKTAERYYQAYRIDHVLGFFRIWASRQEDLSSTLGRFIPYIPINKKDFEDLGFDTSRTRWLSRPHIPTGELWDGLRKDWDGEYQEARIAAEAERTFALALDRIGGEELWLFKDAIKGEKDIEALDLHPAAKKYLIRAWQNRLFVEYEPGLYAPGWYYRDSRAYGSLSGEERDALEALLEKRKRDSERIWADQGKRLLSVLIASSSMLPCAEDLGAVPDCVPRVLAELHILGLRVVRWHRNWDAPGEPYFPFEDYPELSVCTPAVHDSSTLREWWEREADQALFCDFIGLPSLPRIYNPGTAKIILQKTASAASRFRVFQIQDLLHLSPKWYAPDPADERINVPGTYREFNWTYRLPAAIEEIGQDKDLVEAVKELGAVKPAAGRGSRKSSTPGRG
jgi:4-alpha-glucanotransferase